MGKTSGKLQSRVAEGDSLPSTDDKISSTPDAISDVEPRTYSEKPEEAKNRSTGLKSLCHPASKEVEKASYVSVPEDISDNSDSTGSQLPTTSKLILLAACLTFSNIVSSLLAGGIKVILTI